MQLYIEPVESMLPNIIDSIPINLRNLELGSDFTKEIMFTGFHNIATMTMSFRVECAHNTTNCTALSVDSSGEQKCNFINTGEQKRNSTITVVRIREEPVEWLALFVLTLVALLISIAIIVLLCIKLKSASAAKTASEETASEETASEETTSQETASEETASEETTSQETTSEKTTSEETASEERGKPIIHNQISYNKLYQ